MRNKVLMVYPKIGHLEGDYLVRHLPLGVLYASIDLVKNGIDVKILDNRLFLKTWKEEIKKHITPRTLAVGISVMTGEPIKNALEIGKYVKSLDSEISVIWGGPHATYYSESILNDEPNCDYIVSGYGSKALFELITCLLKGKEPFNVQGVSFQKNGDVIETTFKDSFENVNFREIPYHLIDDFSVYNHGGHGKRTFSMFSAYGCPYQCAFCAAPAFYRRLAKRFVTLDVQEVVDHISYVIENYDADYIYFIDDDSFVNLTHTEKIIDEVIRRNIQVQIAFRGARINEIINMSDAFLGKLETIGMDFMHVGAESGSDRILKLVNKNFTVSDIIEANKKLARHSGLKVGYNFIVGLPSEKLTDMKKTRNLMMRLMDDNPHCIIIGAHKFLPIPGTELFHIVKKKWGYRTPETWDDWINLDSQINVVYPWCSKEENRFANLLEFTSFFIDKKIQKMASIESFLFKFLQLIEWLYSPIARFRLKRGIYHLFIERLIYRMFVKLYKLSQ